MVCVVHPFAFPLSYEPSWERTTNVAVTALSAAIAADNLAAYEAAIRVNYPLIANAVIEVEEFLVAVDAGTGSRSGVQAGDTVRGSDHGEIGTVEQVVEATEETDGYLVVPRGLIFQTDAFIPLDAVVKRAGNEVFINVPKLLVGQMPWSEPPSRAERQAKRGPRGNDVDKL